ncbi:hypothetical protein SAMN05216201_109101 [Pseudomonas linyingensis]|uniref:Uncharacterized protein n=1 Tax=Pseudomonas linyingensis TaxID=915471 RepID=A0A1H6ZBH7_9PSED|nr:hypothetical protein [Pseudomonas linyingensis]SEJ47002.1 hypothetical protein SAMN05216201_109101 [Pseudomonas linyingensis]
MSGGGGDSDNTVKDTPEQRYAAQVAAEKWNFAQSTLAPLENEYMARVEDMDSEGRKSYVRGVASQASQAQLGNGLAEVGSQLGQGGINPNSGRWNGTQADYAEGVAQAGGETMGRAQFQNASEQVRGLQNIVAIGSGQEGRAQAGLGQIAAQSASDARGDATNSFNRRSANLQLLGAVGGAAASYGLSVGANGGFTGGAVDNALGAGYAKATGSFDTNYGTAAPLSWQLGIK